MFPTVSPFMKNMSRVICFHLLLITFQVYICHTMKNILKDTHEPVIAEQYHKLQERFDDECTALLDQCFYKNEKNTRVCLEINYVSLIHEHQCEMEDTVELMFVASLGKAQNFLAHPCCQRAIERRWQPGFKVGQISFLLYFFCPILFLRRGPQRLKRREHRVHGENNYGYSSRADTVWYRMYYFYTSPNSKYVIDIVSGCLRFRYIINMKRSHYSFLPPNYSLRFQDCAMSL
ncbi:hypothetical protein Y032_0004g2141 [Ancylostoma ceylanicum]|uniref:Uncharacterized protein n=1 Tax=Ancylostoma ceylanicum TaxID=53326 RepID=A0A016VVH6_9BILA|nr:hypothetical protein Y032_0004g2141 [Ancylostoma ceylanicum]